MSLSMDIDNELQAGSIPFKSLTIYLSILCCLLSTQRDQTFALIDACDMDVANSIFVFYTSTILKTSRRGLH